MQPARVQPRHVDPLDLFSELLALVHDLQAQRPTVERMYLIHWLNRAIARLERQK